METQTTAEDSFIERTYFALQSGNQLTAKRWAERAVALNPNREGPWLILGLLAAPRASVYFMNRALRANPQSERAKAGLRWAWQRQKEIRKSKTGLSERAKAGLRWAWQRQKEIRKSKIAVRPPEKPALISPFLRNARRANIKKFGLLLTAITIVAGCAVLGTVWKAQAESISDIPAFTAAGDTIQMNNMAANLQNGIPTITPTPFFPASQTPSPTATSTQTPTSTSTPQPSPTATLPPTQPVAVRPAIAASPKPAQYSGSKNIVVSLSQQRLFAYQGNELVYSFVVSTGRNNGTLQGNFRILDKISNAYSQPWGFYMPDWMGIYYANPNMENGIHALPVLLNGATIWGNQLGTPISYGCIVLGTGDARVLFAWANIGTPVSIRW